jgi:hypothetical protein
MILYWSETSSLALGEKQRLRFDDDDELRRIFEPFSGITLGYGLDDRGFESREELGIFLFTTVSRPTQGPTQPPIQWVPGILSLGVKRPEREADHSPPSSSDVKECA